MSPLSGGQGDAAHSFLHPLWTRLFREHTGNLCSLLCAPLRPAMSSGLMAQPPYFIQEGKADLNDLPAILPTPRSSIPKLIYVKPISFRNQVACVNTWNWENYLNMCHLSPPVSTNLQAHNTGPVIIWLVAAAFNQCSVNIVCMLRNNGMNGFFPTKEKPHTSWVMVKW